MAKSRGKRVSLDVVEIEPNVGVNGIRFGMTQKQVQALLGPAPRTEIDNIMEEVREQRHGMVFIYAPRKLADIKITRHVVAKVHGVTLFGTRGVIEQLAEYDKPTKEQGGYIAFFGLGLMLGGFGKRRLPEHKLAIAFAPGRRELYENFLLAV